MDHTLVKIKRLILRGKYEFRLSAATQLINDGLTKEDALEAILNADYLVKKNSTSQDKLEPKEKVNFWRLVYERRFLPHVRL